MSQPVQPPQSSPTARLYTILGFVVATAVLYLAKEILIPIALAILISFLLFPLILWIERRGIRRVFAVVMTVVALMAVLGGLGYLLAGQFVEFVDKLPSYRSNIVQKIHAIKPGSQSVFKRAEAELMVISREMDTESTASAASVSTTVTRMAPPVDAEEQTRTETENEDPRLAAERELLGEETEQTSESTEGAKKGLHIIANAQRGNGASVEDAVPVQVVDGPTSSWQTFLDMVGPIVAILGNAGLVMLFVIFFLLQREDLRDRIIRLAGTNQVRVTTEALEEAAKRVSRYLLMQLIVNVTYGIPVALGLWLIGVPNALLWGAMATILRFIPYIGPWIAAAMPIALSLAVFDNWTMPLLTVALFVVLELLSNNIMEPILYGHSTGVSPVAIIVSAVFWTWLWGAVGLVLATPITVCLVVLGGYIPQMAFLRVLLGDEPVLDDDARMYNRLLSGATDEAVEIAEEYLDEHNLEELFDDVLLPALERAETDRSEDMLSQKRYDRLITGMNDLIDSVEDKIRQLEAAEETDETEGQPEVHQEVAAIPVRRIICVPVNDETDEMAGQMLQHLLVLKGQEVHVLSAGKLASEVVESIAEFKPDVIVLSSVPPFAVTHTRYLAKRLAAEFPDIKLYAGLWRGDNTVEKADERLKMVGVAHIFTQLSEASLRV